MEGETQHARSWLIFPEKLGLICPIDETALLQGGNSIPLSTNKKAQGQRKELNSGPYSPAKPRWGDHKEQLAKDIGQEKDPRSKEITLDMANSMKTHRQKMLPKSDTGDRNRFHVQKLALEAFRISGSAQVGERH